MKSSPSFIKEMPSFVKENNVIDLKDLDFTRFIDLDVKEIERNNIIVEKVVKKYRDTGGAEKDKSAFLEEISEGISENYGFKVWIFFFFALLLFYLISGLISGFYSNLSVVAFKLLFVSPLISMLFYPIVQILTIKKFEANDSYLLKKYNIDLNEKTNISKVKILSLMSVFLSSKYCSYSREDKLYILEYVLRYLIKRDNESDWQSELKGKIKNKIFSTVLNCYEGLIQFENLGETSLDDFVKKASCFDNIEIVAKEMISTGNLLNPNFKDNDKKVEIKKIADFFFDKLKDLSQEEKDWFTKDFMNTYKTKFPTLFSVSENQSAAMNSMVAFAVILNSTQVKSIFNDLDRKNYFKALIDSYCVGVLHEGKKVDVFFENFIKIYNEKVSETLKIEKEKSCLINVIDIQKVEEEMKRKMFLD